MPATGDTQQAASPTSTTQPFDQPSILIWSSLSDRNHICVEGVEHGRDFPAEALEMRADHAALARRSVEARDSDLTRDRSGFVLAGWSVPVAEHLGSRNPEGSRRRRGALHDQAASRTGSGR